MPTQNVVVTRSGTSFTIDVTPCNLVADLTLKDFRIFHNGVEHAVTYYTKTTSTLLTYSGPNIGSNVTVEVQRNTPDTPIKVVTGFPVRITAELWNGEIDRITRRAEEYRLNGVGNNSMTVPTPKNDPYGSSWASDTVYPPTRQAVYNKMETMAPLASPALTGTPTAPTAAPGTNSTQIATTAFAAALVDNSAYSSAWDGVTGVAPSKNAVYDKIELMVDNTAYAASWDNVNNVAPSKNAVYDKMETMAPLASPAFTGTPTAPTQGATDYSTRLANTIHVGLRVAESCQGHIHSAKMVLYDTYDPDSHFAMAGYNRDNILLVPYRGRYIGVYNTTDARWELIQITTTILSPSYTTLTSGTVYDVFLYNNSGTPALEFTAWTNTTTRNVALSVLHGVYVRSNNHSRKYIGTIYYDGTGRFKNLTYINDVNVPFVIYVTNHYNKSVHHAHFQVSGQATQPNGSGAWLPLFNDTNYAVRTVNGLPYEMKGQIQLSGSVSSGSGYAAYLGISINNATNAISNAPINTGFSMSGTTSQVLVVNQAALDIGLRYHIFAALTSEAGVNIGAYNFPYGGIVFPC